MNLPKTKKGNPNMITNLPTPKWQPNVLPNTSSKPPALPAGVKRQGVFPTDG